jgi:uncharacterized membrane protein (DUF106 family)
MELLISISAAVIALYAVFIQRKELSAQCEELRKSADANNKSQLALKKQTELQALASLLDTEIHMHNFNNKQEVDAAKQKKWAAKNFEEIESLKKAIRKLLDDDA